MSVWRWTNHDQFRYYQADLVVKDHFGDWTLVTSLVRSLLAPESGALDGVPSYEDGLARIEEIAKWHW